MVRRWSKLPYFDERFINYGCNKVQWIEHLRYLGFEFSVLSQSYALDMPHPPYAFSSLFILVLALPRPTLPMCARERTDCTGCTDASCTTCARSRRMRAECCCVCRTLEMARSVVFASNRR